MGRELITTHILSARSHSYKNANSFRVGIALNHKRGIISETDRKWAKVMKYFIRKIQLILGRKSNSEKLFNSVKNTLSHTSLAFFISPSTRSTSSASRNSYPSRDDKEKSPE
jgi:hypothetical protein